MFWIYILIAFLTPKTERIPLARVDIFIEDNMIRGEVLYNNQVYRSECDVYLDIETLARLHCTEVGMQIRRDHKEFKDKMRKL